MTGIASIAGEDQVFVFDRTDQSRFLLTAKPNEKNMSLVSVVRQDNSPSKPASVSAMKPAPSDSSRHPSNLPSPRALRPRDHQRRQTPPAASRP